MTLCHNDASTTIMIIITFCLLVNWNCISYFANVICNPLFPDAAAGGGEPGARLQLHIRLHWTDSGTPEHLDTPGVRQDPLHLRQEPAHETQGHQPRQPALPHVGGVRVLQDSTQ